MNKDVAKFAIRQIAAFGAGRVVGQVIKSNIAPSNSFDKVVMVIGAGVISAMIGEAVVRFTDAKLEEIEDLIDPEAPVVEPQED